MNEELQRQLAACVRSLGGSQPRGIGDPECWARWLACVGSFQAGKYKEARESAIELLTDRRLPKWFPVLQILLICLQHTEKGAELDRWTDQLVAAAPLIPWQLGLARLVLGQIELSEGLSGAGDEEQVCQVHYYMGENLLCAGSTGEAMESFRRSAAIDAKCVEHRFAERRIEFLETLAAAKPPEDRFSLVGSTKFVPVAPTKEELEKWLRRGSGEQLLSAVSQLLEGQSLQDIALVSDQQRSDTWSRVIQKLKGSKAAARPASDEADRQWIPREARYALADAHKEIFLEQIESVSLIQGHPALGAFRLIKGSDLLGFSQLPRYQNVKNRLTSFNAVGAGVNTYFVSHRWLAIEQPDPDGRQLQLLKQAVLPEAYYWIDYSCVPQRPRTAEEDTLFRESLKWLPALLFDMNVVVVRCNNDRYFSRAWCFFELLAANVLGRSLSYVAEDTAPQSHYSTNERQVLEQTLLDMDLPPSLGADPADLDVLGALVRSVAFFFKLQVVVHYMELGQAISDQRLFFAEDPYYFMATCDFSDVMLWLFDKTRERGMRLIDACQGPHSRSFLSQLAEEERFELPAGDYAMAKKVALDPLRLAWFQANRFRGDSATNLFYKLTAMIK